MKLDIVQFDNGTYGVRVTHTIFGIPSYSGFIDRVTQRIWYMDNHVREYCTHDSVYAAGVTRSKFLCYIEKPKKLKYKVLK